MTRSCTSLILKNCQKVAHLKLQPCCRTVLFEKQFCIIEALADDGGQSKKVGQVEFTARFNNGESGVARRPIPTESPKT